MPLNQGIASVGGVLVIAPIAARELRTSMHVVTGFWRAGAITACGREFQRLFPHKGFQAPWISRPFPKKAWFC